MTSIFSIRDRLVIEFGVIIDNIIVDDFNELRIYLIDLSYIDIWFSPRRNGKFSIHWERKHLDGLIFRHDNAPHIQWSQIKSFPLHFHFETEENVIESNTTGDFEEDVIAFLRFAQEYLLLR